MGREFFPCSNSDCDDGIACDYDCVYCDCGKTYCSEKCALGVGWQYDSDEDTRSCAYCRSEKADDFELLDYLLRKYNLSKEQVNKEYFDVIFNQPERCSELWPEDA